MSVEMSKTTTANRETSNNRRKKTYLDTIFKSSVHFEELDLSHKYVFSLSHIIHR